MKLYIVSDLHFMGTRGSHDLHECNLENVVAQRSLLSEIVTRIELDTFMMFYEYQILLVAMFMGYSEVFQLIQELDDRTKEALTKMICKNPSWYKDFNNNTDGFCKMFTVEQTARMAQCCK